MVTERQILLGIQGMWRIAWFPDHRSLVIILFLLLAQVLAGCGGGTSVAVCASSGPDNDFCSGFGSSGDGDRNLATAPAGLYSLDRIVDRPFVDGVVLRVTWAELEPEPGRYAFAGIADVVTAAARLEQNVTLDTRLDILPEWLRGREQATDSPASIVASLSLLAGALGSLEVDGVSLRNHRALRLAEIAGYGATGAALETVIDIWRAAFPRTPMALESPQIPGAAAVTLPAGTFWLYVDLSTENAAQRVRSDEEAPLLLRACGAWVDPHAWPACHWSADDNPDTALAHAVQRYGASYFEFHAADLESAGYFSQFEYWSSVIAAVQ